MKPFNKFFKLIIFIVPKKWKGMPFWIIMRGLQHPIIYLTFAGRGFTDAYYELPTILAKKKREGKDANSHTD